MPEEGQSGIDTPLIKAQKIKTDLRKKEPPLVDVKVTNPVTYIKSWWKKIIGNEGMDFRFRIRPLTAIAITIIVVTVSLGLGKFVLPFKLPFFEYVSIATPSPEPYRETAFIGELRFSSPTGRYFLLTSSSEAVTLDVPENVSLKGLIDRRVLAFGNYYEGRRTLVVGEVGDLEVLPEEPESVPTSTPSPSATPTPTPTPLPTSTATPEPTTSPSASPTSE